MAPFYVVDTSAWIEWLIDSALGKKLGKVFPDKTQCVVPTIVQLELSKWLVREIGEDQADQVIAYTQKCVVVPLDTPIALLAADLHREHKLATADAIVYATARQQRADLLTCDAHFEGLPHTQIFGKPKTNR
jgi:predicted nucleic acid-binding protein